MDFRALAQAAVYDGEFLSPDVGYSWKSRNEPGGSGKHPARLLEQRVCLLQGLCSQSQEWGRKDTREGGLVQAFLETVSML